MRRVGHTRPGPRAGTGGVVLIVALGWSRPRAHPRRPPCPGRPSPRGRSGTKPRSSPRTSRAARSRSRGSVMPERVRPRPGGAGAVGDLRCEGVAAPAGGVPGPGLSLIEPGAAAHASTVQNRTPSVAAFEQRLSRGVVGPARFRPRPTDILWALLAGPARVRAPPRAIALRAPSRGRQPKRT